MKQNILETIKNKKNDIKKEFNPSSSLRILKVLESIVTIPIYATEDAFISISAMINTIWRWYIIRLIIFV